jgi:phosphoglycolate phosphatase-like HAD superfamily hydrolase
MPTRKPSESVRQSKLSGSWEDAAVFVFDVEGTLVDAVMPTLRCWRETLEGFGHDLSLAELHRLTGMDASEMLAQLLPGTSKPEREDMMERQGERFREEYLPHIPAFPGVRPLFEALKRQDRKIALATDCKKEQLQHYFAVTQIEDLVDAIGCGEDVRHGKPHPDLVEVALRRVKAGRKPAVMIGDTPFDAAAARKAGIQAVGVLTGHFSEHALRDAGCDAVFRDIAALREAVAHNAQGAGAATAAPAV